MKREKSKTIHPKIIYTRTGPVIEEKKGVFYTTRLMWRELVSARELTWRLFVRDFSAKYRQSVLGILWAVLMPLAIVCMFIGMRGSGVLSIGDVGVPYVLYAVVGITIWNLFTVGLTAAVNSMIQAGPMVVKINFPKSAVVLAASGQGLVEFIIRTVLITFVFVYYGIAPSPLGATAGVLLLLPIYLLTLGLGFVFSLVAGVLRDITSVLNIVLMTGMFLTPILYPITGESLLAKANVYNPFNYLVNVPRDYILSGTAAGLTGFWASAAVSMVIFFLGWRLFYLAQTKIAERI